MAVCRAVGNAAGYCVEWLIRFCHFVATAAILGIFAIILSQVIARYQGAAIPGAIQFVAMLLPVAIALELASALVTGSHIRVELLLMHLPWKWRAKVEGGCWLAGSVLAGALTYASAAMAWQSYAFGAVDNQGQVAIPLVYPHATVAFGIFVLFLAAVREFVRALSRKEAEPDSDPIDRLATGL